MFAKIPVGGNCPVCPFLVATLAFHFARAEGIDTAMAFRYLDNLHSGA